mmetsp:Transcript_46593/g.134215  ORF Transcript_46593/g.134215 Transcript_46593/m.134215 type:complete len:91 (-) Transcript_46593:166-438(-)
MVRLNTIVSSLDKNPQMQEPHIHGSMRKIGHVRSVWQSLPPHYGAHWFGMESQSAGGAGRPAIAGGGAVAVEETKPRYPYFDPARVRQSG